jgi:hypothetical protein
MTRQKQHMCSSACDGLQGLPKLHTCETDGPPHEGTIFLGSVQWANAPNGRISWCKPKCLKVGIPENLFSCAGGREHMKFMDPAALGARINSVIIIYGAALSPPSEATSASLNLYIGRNRRPVR